MTDRGQNKQNKAVLILVRVIKTAFYNLTARLSFQGKLHGLYLWWWLFFFLKFCVISLQSSSLCLPLYLSSVYITIRDDLWSRDFLCGSPRSGIGGL